MGSLTVKNLLKTAGERLELKILSGTEESLRREIDQATVGTTISATPRRPGEVILLTTDPFRSFPHSSKKKRKALSFSTDLSGVPCVVIPSKTPVNGGWMDFLRALPVPVLSSGLEEAVIKSRLTGILREALRGERSLCGVLVTVAGRGVFIRGESGSGKSRCALELVARGGRLVSDDVVELRRVDGRSLVGRSPGATKDLLALRGAGIVNARHLLGGDALADESPVDLLVELTESGGTLDAERKAFHGLLEVILPLYRLPAKDPLKAAEAIADKILGEHDPDSRTRAFDSRQDYDALAAGSGDDKNAQRDNGEEGEGPGI